MPASRSTRKCRRTRSSNNGPDLNKRLRFARGLFFARETIKSTKTIDFVFFFLYSKSNGLGMFFGPRMFNGVSMSDYESALGQIPFYRVRPFLAPFVGRRYASPSHRKLLIIGESHYAPEGETLHHNVEGWYDGSTKVTEALPLYWNCYTRKTFAEWNSGRFSKTVLGELGNLFQTENPAEEVAFYNYFLRPADNRQSFVKICTERDREMSAKTFACVLKALSPDVVCFASYDAIQCAEADFPKFCGRRLWDDNGHVFYVNHPAHSWWNRATRPEYFHGLTSREFFREQLSENWLLKT